MKKSFFVAVLALCASSAALADWQPLARDTKYVTTVSAGGGSATINEPANTSYDPSYIVAQKSYDILRSIQLSLNDSFASSLNSNGVMFKKGDLTGSLSGSISPNSNGTATFGFSGLSYRGDFQGVKNFGSLSVTCDVSIYIPSISVTGQWGKSVSADASQTTSSWNSATPYFTRSCSSSLWLLPDSIFNFLFDSLFSSRLNSAMTGIVDKVRSSLIVGGASNYQTTLNQLIPLNTKIGNFQIGVYVRDNLPLILENSSISFTIDRGYIESTTGVRGIGEPGELNNQYNVISISVNSPGLYFSVSTYKNEYINRWKWKCSIDNPSLVCPAP